jgi:hypothetical protein
VKKVYWVDADFVTLPELPFEVEVGAVIDEDTIYDALRRAQPA